MSITPESLPAQAVKSTGRRFRRLCFAILAFDIGVFLAIFPWTDHWSFNSLQNYGSLIANLWEEPFFRGAISGLGLANVYLGLTDLVQILRQRG